MIRDNFNFHIVNFPHLDSNIPTKPAYGTYASQVVRIGRICDSYKHFKDRHYILTTRLLKQGYKFKMLCGTFKNVTTKHKDVFNKFKVTLKQHIKDGIALPLNSVSKLGGLVTRRQ